MRVTMLIWQAKRTDVNKTYDEFWGYICVAPDLKTASEVIPAMLRDNGQDRATVGLPLTDQDWAEEKDRYDHVEESDRPVWDFQVIGEAIGDTSTRVIMEDFANA